ncbi:MAG: dihydrofolate reductase [Cellvibrionaceae bacterium]|nr:dihydrofolate reductase [Cellvibrionaceae bacterium]
MSDPQLALVCALSRNRAIGLNNQLPWHLPRDLAHFKAVTMGHPIIMGRKTFDSIGRPLPGRSNIVVSRRAGWLSEGVTVVNSLEAAIDCAAEIARRVDKKEIMLIGGASLYQQALPLAQRLYLTEVHADIPGDAFFPPITPGEWSEISREEWPADEKNPLACSFVGYERPF